MDYTPGQRLRLTAHVGYDPSLDRSDPRHPDRAATDPMHVGMHPLFAGQVGEVAAVVPPGDHNGHPGDVVILKFDHRRFVDHGRIEVAAADGSTAFRPDPDNPVHEEVPDVVRHVSFTAEQMAELFEGAE
jgi:hypothetical protein